MTLVPHRCARPGQPGAQLPANIWAVGALQPSKGLNLPQSCHRLTGLSPPLTLSAPIGVGTQRQLRNNPSGAGPHSSQPSPLIPSDLNPTISCSPATPGQGTGEDPPRLAGFVFWPSLPQGSSGFAEGAQLPILLPGAGQALTHQT